MVEASEAEKSGVAPRKRDWQRDMVYLFQFPRASVIPSISPFCLKLETWLRIANIDYENVDNKIGTFSKQKGFLPFIEFNGQEVSDSNVVIDMLTQVFQKDHLDSHLSEQDKAVARAFHALIEDSCFWTGLYERSLTLNEVFGDSIAGAGLSGMAKFFRPLLTWRISKIMKNKLYYQGMGRNTASEVIDVGEKDLRALSTYLENKKFMTGDTATKLDATAFGHLCQIWFIPVESKLKKFMGSQCPNLVEYLERMKSTYWPDWQEICSSLSLHTQWKMQPSQSPTLANAAQ